MGPAASVPAPSPHLNVRHLPGRLKKGKPERRPGFLIDCTGAKEEVTKGGGNTVWGGASGATVIDGRPKASTDAPQYERLGVGKRRKRSRQIHARNALVLLVHVGKARPASSPLTLSREL